MIPFATPGECAGRFAGDVAARLRDGIDKRGRASLAVSGGRTPEYLFPALAREKLPWDRVGITLADERWVDAGHPDSNEGLARRLLLQGPASRARFTGLKTEHANPLDARVVVEAALANLDWPLDAVFLGMGADGHIASLFPDLDNWQGAPGRALAVSGAGERQPRMSLTPAALLDSRHIFLVIAGPEKRAAYDAAMRPGPAGEYPVRLILHQNRVPVTVYAVN